MPVATCFLAGAAAVPDPDEIVTAWSAAAGIGPDDMTVNLVPVVQGGRRYAAMAQLSLPSAWSDDEIDALSAGLASALAGATGADPSEVQVITTVLPSGTVVEAGRVVRW